MGRKIVLTGTTLTDTTAPRLVTVDPIESAGSLLLFDYAHPLSTFPATVPATGAAIPNLFGSQLAALGGAGSADGILNIGGAIANGTKGKVERSGKGGLHVVVSQANALASGDGVAVQAPAALYAYMVANASHDYYVSAWDRLTRANIVPDMAMLYGFSSYTVVGLVNINPEATYQGGALLGAVLPGNTVGPRRASAAVDAYVPDASASVGSSGLPQWGAPPDTFNDTILASRNQKWPSFIAYRLYVEDLTVSGRTYAEVDAIDYALYTQHVLTPGGRYYGDTFTDPTTIP